MSCHACMPDDSSPRARRAWNSTFYPLGRGAPVQVRACPAPAMRRLAAARCVLMAASICGIAAGTSAGQAQPKAAVAATDLGLVSRTLEALSDRVGPAVVQVFAVGYAVPPEATEERSLLAQQRSTGSGVILDPAGYIVTNAHVVQGAYKVQVQLAAPRRGASRSIVGPRPRMVGAQIVAIDEETDLSVLKIDEKALPSL